MALQDKTLATGVLDILSVDGGIDASTARNVADGDGTASPLYLTTTKVGIGVSSPQSILHLSSGTTDQPLITIDHESSSDSSQGGTVNFVKRDSDGAVLADDIVLGDIGFRGTEAGGTERSGAMIRGRTQDAWTDGGNCGTELAFYTAQTTSSGTQQRMCIQKDGKVGIGTASPQGMLHVGGSESNTSSDTDNLFLSEGIGLEFMGSASNSGYGFKIEIDDLSDGVGGHSLGFHERIDSASWTATPVLSINASASGNSNRVGINTATPESTLHIHSSTSDNPILTISHTGSAGNEGGNILFKTRETSGYLNNDAEIGDIISYSYDDGGSTYRASTRIRSVATGTQANNRTGGEIQFWTNADTTSTSQRMVIDSAGKVGIGQSSPTFPLHVVGEGPTDYVAMFDNSSANQDSHGIVIRAGDTDHLDSATHYILFEESDGDDVGELDSNGGNLGLTNTSDYRLKENINLITGGLAKVNALKPSTFNYKKYPNKVHEGFIAHEVVDAGIGYSVKGDKDAVKDDGSINPQKFRISSLIPQMVSAIQELSAKVTALENA